MSSKIRRREAEEFAQALDHRGSKSAAPADGISELIDLTHQLRRATSVHIPEDFGRDLRVQLMTEAQDILVPIEPSRSQASAPRARTARRRWAAFATVCVAVLGTIGMVSTSASALPGDMLYPVKRSTESVQLFLHRSDDSRGTYQLSLAERRLDEVDKLVASGKQKQIVPTLEDFTSRAESGSADLFAAYGSHQSVSSVTEVASFVAKSSAKLELISDELPADAGAALESAAATVAGLASRAADLCTSCEKPDVSSLAKVVNKLVRSGKAPLSPKPARGSTPGKAPASPPRATVPDITPTLPSPEPETQPAPKTNAPPSQAPSSPSPPKLTDVTDPLIGSLLGSEDQTGLVPGLLGGLLGTPSR